MNFKKFFALGLTSVLLVGCGSDTSSSPTPATQSADAATPAVEQVEIVFWHAMTGNLENVLKTLTDDFMAQNPEINVTLQNQSSYNDLQQKITATMMSPNHLPTITQAYPQWLEYAIADELMVDLKPMIYGVNGISDYESDFIEGFRTPTEIDGKIYSMPFNKSTEVLWYNRDLFIEHELSVPTSFPQFEDTAREIYEKAGIVGGGFDALGNYYSTYLKTLGKTLDADLDVTGIESFEAVDFLVEGINEGYFRIAGTDNYLSGPFANEILGMYVGSNAGESFVKQGVGDKFEIGVAPYPSTIALQQGTDLYMFNSASEAQQEAGFEYLKFLTSTESQITWGVETGYIPVRSSSLNDSRYLNGGSLVAPIVGEATKSVFTNNPTIATDSAQKEAINVIESAIYSDVTSELKTFANTLKSIWE